jgi:hypothetical protein
MFTCLSTIGTLSSLFTNGYTWFSWFTMSVYPSTGMSFTYVQVVGWSDTVLLVTLIYSTINIHKLII